MNGSYMEIEKNVLAEIPAIDADFLVTSKTISKLTNIPQDVCKAVLRELRVQNKVVLVNGYNLDECQVQGSGYVRAV